MFELKIFWAQSRGTFEAPSKHILIMVIWHPIILSLDDTAPLIGRVFLRIRLYTSRSAIVKFHFILSSHKHHGPHTWELFFQILPCCRLSTASPQSLCFFLKKQVESTLWMSEYCICERCSRLHMTLVVRMFGRIIFRLSHLRYTGWEPYWPSQFSNQTLCDKQDDCIIYPLKLNRPKWGLLLACVCDVKCFWWQPLILLS